MPFSDYPGMVDDAAIQRPARSLVFGP